MPIDVIFSGAILVLSEPPRYCDKSLPNASKSCSISKLADQNFPCRYNILLLFLQHWLTDAVDPIVKQNTKRIGLGNSELSAYRINGRGFSRKHVLRKLLIKHGLRASH